MDSESSLKDIVVVCSSSILDVRPIFAFNSLGDHFDGNPHHEYLRDEF